MESLGQVAVKSKQQGDAVDYRVIARSEGPLSSEDFESAFRELSVGTMPPPDSALGEGAPWFTIGSFVCSERHYLAVIRQGWTNRQDVHGRSVVAQYCLCVSDSVLAEQSPGYTNLCANIPPEQYFLGSQKELLVDPKVSYEPLTDKVKEILQVINEVGFDFCSFVAALLLTSPVAIMRGQELSVETRLSFFDAVASLLPYNARTKLGVSTWMNSTSASKIHLGFSDAVLPNQKRVVWKEVAPKELGSNPAVNDYHKLLHKLWNDPQADKQQIISELASKRTPVDFRNAQSFLKALREVNWEKHVYDDVKKERGKKEDVRELLTSKKRRKLTQEQVTELLLFLLEASPLELDDIEILRKNWDESFWVPACDLVKKELQYPTFRDDALWALCGISAETGWLEKFLEALLEPGNVASLRPKLKLFYRAIHEFDYNKSRVRYLLLRDPRLLYEILFMVGGSFDTHDELGQMLTWVGEDKNSKDVDLTAFRIAYGLLDKEASPDMIMSLAKLDESYVEKLFRIATTRVHLTNNYLAIWHLTCAVSTWLLGRLDSLKKEEADIWAEHLRLMLKGPHKSADIATQLDLICLALHAEGDKALLLDEYMKQEQVSQIESYGEAFVNNLYRTKFSSHQIIERLIRYLDRLNLNSTELSNDMFLIGMLMSEINREHVKNYLIAHLTRSITQNPSLLTHEAFVNEISKRLFDWGKEKRLLDILHAAFNTAARNKGPVEQIVEIYLQMWELEMPLLAERATEVFSATNYFDDLRKIESFVKTLRENVKRVAETPEQASDQIRVLQKSLMSINSVPMWEYREEYINDLIDTLTSANELVALVAKVMDEKQAGEVRELLEKMRESVPGPRFFGLMSRKRNDKVS